MNIAFNYLIVHQFVNFKRVYIFYNRKISSNTSNAGKKFLVDFFLKIGINLLTRYRGITHSASARCREGDRIESWPNTTIQ